MLFVLILVVAYAAFWVLVGLVVLFAVYTVLKTLAEDPPPSSSL